MHLQNLQELLIPIGIICKACFDLGQVPDCMLEFLQISRSDFVTTGTHQVLNIGCLCILTRSLELPSWTTGRCHCQRSISGFGSWFCWRCLGSDQRRGEKCNIYDCRGFPGIDSVYAKTMACRQNSVYWPCHHMFFLVKRFLHSLCAPSPSFLLFWNLLIYP